MSLSYGYEKFTTAVSSAISNEDPLKVRLANAYTHNLIGLGSDDVPAEVWAELKKMEKVVTAVSTVGSEGRIVASTSVMSDEKAGKWLKEIVSMFGDVAEAYGAENHRDDIEG